MPPLVRRALSWLVGVALLVAIGGNEAAAQRPAITPTTAASAAAAVADVVEREYFDSALAARLAQAIRSRASAGDYADQPTWDALASALTIDLVRVSKDKHLAVRPLAPASSAATPSAPEDRQVRGRRTNFGIQRVEVLAGNVGYLNLTAFFRPEEARDALVAAMELLRSADAVILDLRENGGGSPDTVAFLTSYFFDASNLPLFDIVSRQGEVQRYATSQPAVPHRHGTRPMYVLTARGTFSAGEGIAFILQERKRATVIGEGTAGAANPGRPYPAGQFLEVTVPNGQVRTAVTGRNWEGAGVTPDVAAPAADALRLAHIHALRDLLKAGGSDPWQNVLRRELERLTTAAAK